MFFVVMAFQMNQFSNLSLSNWSSQLYATLVLSTNLDHVKDVIVPLLSKYIHKMNDSNNVLLIKTEYDTDKQQKGGVPKTNTHSTYF